MSPQVFKSFEALVMKHFPDRAPASALEVGAGAWTLLAMPVLKAASRVALNLRFDKVSDELAACQMVLGNGNALEFPDDTFDCILSSSTLEHDKYFWKTAAEVRRVLKPGGMFIVGVPIYMTLPTDKEHSTVTYARHGIAYNADYYRFSEQAVRELFFEGYEAVTDEVIVRTHPNPYMIAAGRK